MSFNLTILNLAIGLTRSDAGLPTSLAGLGYKVHAIEKQFGNSKHEPVQPEIILASTSQGHSLLVESKEGGNVDLKQARRYADITIHDLRTKAYVPSEASEEFDVVFVVPQGVSDKARVALRGAELDFPLLAYDEEYLRLVGGQFKHRALGELFEAGLLCPRSAIPQSYVPIDGQSALGKVASVVLPKLVEVMVNRVPMAKIDSICHDTCPWWDMLGKPGQEQYRGRVIELGEALAGSGIGCWIGWDKRQKVFKIKQNPFEQAPKKQAVQLRQLQAQIEVFIAKLSPDYDIDKGGQMLLFGLDE